MGAVLSLSRENFSHVEIDIWSEIKRRALIQTCNEFSHIDASEIAVLSLGRESFFHVKLDISSEIKRRALIHSLLR